MGASPLWWVRRLCKKMLTLKSYDLQLRELIKICGIIQFSLFISWENQGIEKLRISSTFVAISSGIKPRSWISLLSFWCLFPSFALVSLGLQRLIHSFIHLHKHLLNGYHMASVGPGARNPAINKILLSLSQNSLFHLSE